MATIPSPDEHAPASPTTDDTGQQAQHGKQPEESALPTSTEDKVISVGANAVKGMVVGALLGYGGGQANQLLGLADTVTHQAILGASLGATIGLAMAVLAWIGSGWKPVSAGKEAAIWIPVGACIGALIFATPPLVKPAIIWITGGWLGGFIPALCGAVIGGAVGVIVGLLKGKA